MTMLPRFYCNTCNSFKHRWEVKKEDDFRFYWYTCKWCHKPVAETTYAVESALKLVLPHVN